MNTVSYFLLTGHAPEPVTFLVIALSLLVMGLLLRKE
jgi:hypothetical protein